MSRASAALTMGLALGMMPAMPTPMFLQSAPARHRRGKASGGTHKVKVKGMSPFEIEMRASLSRTPMHRKAMLTRGD